MEQKANADMNCNESISTKATQKKKVLIEDITGMN